jgi:PIN domain nuclease of toxin-antitoxin system
MLIKKGRLDVGGAYQEFIQLVLDSNKYIFQGITPEIAELSTQPVLEVSNDPADKIIAATALVKNAQLVTADRKLRSARSIPTIW